MSTHTNLRSHKLSKGKLRIQRSILMQFLLQTLRAEEGSINIPVGHN